VHARTLEALERFDISRRLIELGVYANESSLELRAKYVVGADGFHSIVRQKTGVEFDGATYSHSFILADVRMDWALDAHEVMLFFSPEGFAVVAPMPHGRHRIVATVDEASPHPSRDEVQAVLDARGPLSPPAIVKELVWSSRFHLHHRVARHYRDGRLLLAGEAAHVHSPAGGQGMNTGIQDACMLGAVLAQAIREGGNPEEVLDGYEKRRRPVAQNVVALTDRLTRVANIRGHAKRWMRNLAISAFGHVPAVRSSLAMQLSELSNR
jgi:2-polyprenyl-6-methoxyphenol hydroxylase-like FAD-dependent oxidoreductase